MQFKNNTVLVVKHVIDDVYNVTVFSSDPTTTQDLHNFDKDLIIDEMIAENGAIKSHTFLD